MYNEMEVVTEKLFIEFPSTCMIQWCLLYKPTVSLYSACIKYYTSLLLLALHDVIAKKELRKQ